MRLTYNTVDADFLLLVLGKQVSERRGDTTDAI